jgi:hypothetical protein
MEQGVYLTYSRWVPSPDHILITAIVIEKKGEHTYFSRQYSFEGDPSPLGDRQPRWLDGIVLQDQGYISMIGRLRGIDLPGYLTINLNLENRANKNLWSAVASMVLPNGIPNANSIILERTPGLSIEQAGAAIGVHPVSHGLIPEDAKSIFDAFLTQPTHATFAVNFQNKWDG